MLRGDKEVIQEVQITPDPDKAPTEPTTDGITETQWKKAAKTQKKIPGANTAQRRVGGVWYTMTLDGNKYKYVKVAP